MDKNSQVYKIERWDGVSWDGVTPVPIIYIKPDDKLMKLASDNDNTLLLKINTPLEIYNNRLMYGIFAKSSEIPNCRSNFFKKTGLYVIVLQSEWGGYPDCLGTCEVFGVSNNDSVSKEMYKSNFLSEECGDKLYSMDNFFIFLILGGILLILLFSFIITKNIMDIFLN